MNKWQQELEKQIEKEKDMRIMLNRNDNTLIISYDPSTEKDTACLCVRRGQRIINVLWGDEATRIFEKISANNSENATK